MAALVLINSIMKARAFLWLALGSVSVALASAPLQSLVMSPGMSRAAADHCAEQAGGGMSHRGRSGR